LHYNWRNILVKTEFISVEIVLHTDDESSEWITWFEGQDNCVTKTSSPDAKWNIYFAPIRSVNPDLTIRNLCNQIESLPDEIRQYWTSALRREFFVGYQAGTEWPCLIDDFSLETLELVTEMKAVLRLAIYPASPD
jgi:hypothetical protein